jgi:hypothetical protein
MITANEAVSLVKMATTTFRPDMVAHILSHWDREVKFFAEQGYVGVKTYTQAAGKNCPQFQHRSDRDWQAALCEAMRLLRTYGFEVSVDSDTFPFEALYWSRRIVISWERATCLQGVKHR